VTTAESLCNAFGYLEVEEVAFIKKLTADLPPNPVVVNIGAGSGTSGLAFVEKRADLILYTIDFRASSPLGGLENERNAFAGAGFLGMERHRQILGDSAETGRNWKGPKIDLIFIDGAHGYLDVKADIEAWYPHMKPNGLMVFHDYGADPWVGVKRAVDEMMKHQELLERVANTIAFRVSNR